MREKEKHRRPKVYFVGAGPGDPELITVKGHRLIEEADLIIYAGSLVNPELLDGLKAELVDSSQLSLERTTSSCCKPCDLEKGLSGCTAATRRFTGPSWSRCSHLKRPV
jgi:precorrin-4 methylase